MGKKGLILFISLVIKWLIQAQPLKRFSSHRQEGTYTRKVYFLKNIWHSVIIFFAECHLIRQLNFVCYDQRPEGI